MTNELPELTEEDVEKWKLIIEDVRQLVQKISYTDASQSDGSKGLNMEDVDDISEENKIELKNLIYKEKNEKTRDIFFVTKEINGCIIWKTQEKNPYPLVYDNVFLRWWKGNCHEIAIEHCKEICSEFNS